VRHAAFPVALVPAPDGGFLYAERLTGRVRRVTADGALIDVPVATLEVSTSGQRGLLGLALGDDDRLFAAWTARGAAKRILVGQVAPDFRVVWRGPPSATLANGGHLVFDPTDQSLVIGIGDLGMHRRVANPNTANGKLLRLRPDGSPAQVPQLVSSGWNNPFAFSFVGDGALWVADNAPGDRPERLARGDLDARPTHVTKLPPSTAPSALAALSERAVVVCSFLRQQTLRYDIAEGRAARSRAFGDGETCATSVALTTDGSLVLADETSIRRARAA